MENQTVTEDLSAYAASALKRALPAEVAEKAKQHLLDTLAAMVSGSQLRPGKIAIQYIRSQGGRREASVAGCGVVTTAVNAALANGMLAHADETDDAHAPSLTHPGCAVVPAALAMAEREGSSGAELLRAVVLGYDIVCRTVLALGPEQFFKAQRDTHSFGGVFGAAVAAGALAGLDQLRMRYVISYAAQQASGVTFWVRDQDHVEKAFDFGGMPARNGVAAATMVAAGMTGVKDALDGDRNFIAAFSPCARPEELLREIGVRYEIMRASIKKWSVASPAQAALDALDELMHRHCLKGEEVRSITVNLPDQSAHLVDNRAMPDLNIQHLIALLLADGRLGFESSHDYGRMSDSVVARLRARVELIPSAELSKAEPPRQAIVAVHLNDGRRFSHRTYAVKGTADNPMYRHEIEEKTMDLVAPVQGADKARSLISTIWELERVEDVRSLRPLLQTTRGPGSAKEDRS